MSWAARPLVAVVRAYQRWLSPVLPPRCRFHPSCSSYAVTALQRHGALKGSGLAAWRILRCQPFSAGGVDEVPPRGTSQPGRTLHAPDAAAADLPATAHLHH